jgi:hypothetical protein
LADEIKENEVSGHEARMEEEINVYRVLVGKTEGKRPLGRPRCGLNDGIRMDLKAPIHVRVWLASPARLGFQ